jgi:CDP-diacylglycerol--serine O-phosphatidyltransferase
MIASKKALDSLPKLAIAPTDFETLFSASQFRAEILSLISSATKRIYIAALYLESDEGGKEVFDAIYHAKQSNPDLDVQILVDWHRAQRGRIGESDSYSNAQMYTEYSLKYQHSISVYGVPVRGREVFGVLHLKGFVFDDTVLYSGASLNDIYLNKQDRYRFDRYHKIVSKELSDSMVSFIQKELIANPAVNLLTDDNKPNKKELKAPIKQLRSSLSHSKYDYPTQQVSKDQVGISALVGVGKRRNYLNLSINNLLRLAKDEIVICTPYFNFPKSVAKEVKKALKRGVKVSIIVGDKTANDFYIPPGENFNTAGGLPYLYEMNLRQYAKVNEANIASRKLSIHLWKHESNSYHLKGIWIDKRYMMLTGNNLNPRAWSLDLENGLLITDDHHLLTDQFQQELDNILEHTQLVCTYRQLDKIDSYPEDVKKLLRKVTRVRADKILKKLL